MTRTGTQLVTAALRELGVLDPIEAAHAEQLADGILAATEMLDGWRTDKLFVRGVTRSVYSLTQSTQAHTIGTGGTFNQDYPTAILAWSVIPDDDATNPVEQPRGRPVTFEEWQQVRVKSLTAAYPQTLYYDAKFTAGLGTCYFHPIPDNADVDVVLYSEIPQITSLVAATSYDLPPGYGRAIIKNLAIELAGRYGKTATDRLERQGLQAIGAVRRGNIIPHESPIRSDFAIGSRRRGFNVYTGS